MLRLEIFVLDFVFYFYFVELSFGLRRERIREKVVFRSGFDGMDDGFDGVG